MVRPLRALRRHCAMFSTLAVQHNQSESSYLIVLNAVSLLDKFIENVFHFYF